MNLQADLSGHVARLWKPIGFGHGVTVDTDAAVAALERDLHEEPALFVIGFDAAADLPVDAAGGIDGLDGTVDLDLESAVRACGAAMQEDAAVDAIVAAHQRGEFEVAELLREIG